MQIVLHELQHNRSTMPKKIPSEKPFKFKRDKVKTKLKTHEAFRPRKKAIETKRMEVEIKKDPVVMDKREELENMKQNGSLWIRHVLKEVVWL